MNFNESINLNVYSDNAKKQFNEMESRLSEIESSFQNRMDGKSTGGLVGAFIGTLAWLATFIVCAVIVRRLVNGTLLTITWVTVLGLVAFMLIDNIVNFSYYGKISAYKKSVSLLQNRVSTGKSSIKSNHNAFMRSKANGWNYLLEAGSSIPEEATSIVETMANMESLKKGFINGAKNVFFYAAVVMVTIAGCVALFPVGGKIITGISGEYISDNILMVLYIIALLVIVVGEVIMAKFVWSKTDCAVTNTTLFIMLLGPIAFLALIAIATLLVMLVTWLIGAAIAILAVVFVAASLCGG